LKLQALVEKKMLPKIATFVLLCGLLPEIAKTFQKTILIIGSALHGFEQIFEKKKQK
jgi:hypothetical protein